MKITIEIPDAEVHRVLAPLLHKDALPSVDEPGAAMPGPAMMRIGDAANHLAISRHSLYQLVARGEVPSVKIGRSIRIPAGSLSTFIREESLRQKQEKEATSQQWKDWARPTQKAQAVIPKPALTPSRVKRQPKPPKKPFDLTPKPRPAESNGWTREDHVGVLKHMEEGGWPAELTALMLEDWDAGVLRNYVLRAADLAELLVISRSTAGAMIRRGAIPSFSPEPVYRNDKRETLVSVLDYQRFVGNQQTPVAVVRSTHS